MPELPDITVYVEALHERLIGRRLVSAVLASPFLLRTASPPLEEFIGLPVESVQRVGKRIAIGFAGERWLVIHLMIAGRLQWQTSAARGRGRNRAASFQFESGTLLLTEAGSKKRASLHLLQGRDALHEHDPGGMEVLAVDVAAFASALTRENHTVKRALTDPRIFSGIGNAYSDEILHRARLSPVKLTSALSAVEIERLHAAVQTTLAEWTARLRADAGEEFPRHVTAFREGMAVHGRYRQACPVCGTPVQRIRYASNETNYCPRCQTEGRVLADRSLSRLLKQDWPRSVEELEALRGGGRS